MTIDDEHQRDPAVARELAFSVDHSEGPVGAARAALAMVKADADLRLHGGHLLRLLLRLDATFEGELASELYVAIVDSIYRAGDDWRAFGHVTAEWLLVSEYYNLHDQLTPDARALIAESIIDLQWSQAAERAANWNPGGARGNLARAEARRVLRTSGHLHGILFPSRTWATADNLWHKWTLWLGMALVAFVLWLLWGNGSKVSSVDQAETRRYDAVEQTRNEDVKRLAGALRGKDCSEARVYASRIEADAAARGAADVRAALAELRPLARLVCPEIGLPGR